MDEETRQLQKRVLDLETDNAILTSTLAEREEYGVIKHDIVRELRERVRKLEAERDRMRDERMRAETKVYDLQQRVQELEHEQKLYKREWECVNGTVEELQTELSESKQRVRELEGDLKAAWEIRQGTKKRAEKAEAERDRYRAALEQVQLYCQNTSMLTLINLVDQALRGEGIKSFNQTVYPEDLMDTEGG